MVQKKAGDDLLEKFEEHRIYNIRKFLSSPAEFNWGILVRTQNSRMPIEIQLTKNLLMFPIVNNKLQRSFGDGTRGHLYCIVARTFYFSLFLKFCEKLNLKMTNFLEVISDQALALRMWCNHCFPHF